ncbi:hypothetical protein [Vibrio gazogenes]|uniref:Uncharacterized protein n=1 Tax=Vibrio gazogenes TaxID=687 RepID=A0A1Z2SMI3_VIBGA|nr:hypothetical protein [Vibrio gazogenes]ASA54423.1 hypothetical protein BSQ33_00895 [Vibrio gazogenes]ASA58372.1 hypothetical protein BSQ33_21460 [Vibrio gazogenes]
MIPSFGGGLTNSGTMPISANGGQAGPSGASNKSSFGGIRNGAINFGGGSPGQWIPWIAVAIGVTWWLCRK